MTGTGQINISTIEIAGKSGDAALPGGMTIDNTDIGTIDPGIGIFLGQPLNVKDFGVVGDGVTDDTAAMQDALDAISATGGVLDFGYGEEYLISSSLLLSSANNIILDFQNSSFITTTNNLVFFSFTACSQLTTKNGFFTGNNTSSAVTNGLGMLFTNCDYLRIKNNYFTQFGGGSIRITSTSVGGHGNYWIEDNVFYKNADHTGSNSSADCYIQGAVYNVNARNNAGTAHDTLPLQIGIFIANNGSTLNWVDIKITNNRFTAYARGGIFTTDENADATFRDGEILVDGNFVANCIQEGIKLKNNQRVVVTNNQVINCDQTAEIAGNLQGAILVNGSAYVNISNNVIITAQNNGIRILGQDTSGSYTTGAGRSNWIISGNILDSIYGGSQKIAAIFANIYTYNANICNNTITNSKTGIYVDGDGSAGRNPSFLNIIGNNYRFGVSSATGSGIVLNQCQNIVLGMNQIKEAQEFGAVLSNCTNVEINGGCYIDSGQAALPGAKAGIRVSATDNIRFLGIRAGNLDYSTQDYGISLNSNNTNIIIEGCDLSNNSSGAVNGITSDILIGNNIGVYYQNINLSGANNAFQINGVNALSFPSADSGSAGSSIAIGPSAAANFPASTGYNATAIGYQSQMGSVSTTTAAQNNTSIGYQALKAITTATNNTVVGSLSGAAITTGHENTIIGEQAAPSFTTGSHNTVVGRQAGQGFATSASNNTCVGDNAGSHNSTGSSNTVIGFGVGSVTITTGSGNILIGCSSVIDTPLSSTSNYLAIGNSATPVISATGINSTPVITFGGSVTGVTMNAVGNTLVLKQGANGKTGTVTLNGVTPVTVTNSSITANSGVIFTLKTVGGTVGAYPAIQTITASTGFTVAGTALDTSTYNYHIIESAA